MRAARVWLLAFVTVCAAARAARADLVYLEGGRVLEGSAKQEGDKVVVELESGRISVPALQVVRIEHAQPPLVEARERERSIAPNDIAGLLRLADFCRDHDLAGKERHLLERIIAVAPDHAEARRRLGYVHTREGWVDGAELVRRDQHAQLERREAALAREKQAVELKLAEAELARVRARDEAERREREERERAAAQPQPTNTPLYFPLGYGYGYGYGGSFAGYRGPRNRPLAPPSGPPAFPIPGVRDPHDTSFPIPGVRDPASYFDGAFRRH
ncbi:MAG TPA: hypothetical protein VG963_27640 [Polyangiaceae bacterium]|nr:hypothetical protein [Polyangiaceae bacterium]